MPVGDHLLGLAILAVTVGASLVTAGIVVRRRLGHLVGAPRVAAFGLVASTSLVGIHLVAGAAGLLARGTVVVLALIVAAGATRIRPAAAPDPAPAPPPVAPSGRASSLIAGGTALAATAFALAETLRLATTPLTSIDMLTSHLPSVARWIQTGSVWELTQFVPDQAHGNYPYHGNLIQVATVLPWHNDALVRFTALPFAALTAVALYAIARELRAPRATGVVVAALAMSLPVIVDPAVAQAMPDPFMLAAFAAGVLFLLRHVRVGGTPELVLAGLGLGLALGTKWYGVSSVAVVVAVWAAASLVARRAPRNVARDGALLVAVTGVSGGFWLVRNLILSGNPFFPVKVELLGVTIFDAPFDRIRAEGGFSLLHYATDLAVWRDYLAADLFDMLAVGGILVLAAALVAGVGAARRPRDGRVMATAVAAVLLAAVYTATPYTALGPEGRPLLADVNVRYLVPALILAVPLTAVLLARLGRWRVAGEAVLALLAVHALLRAYDVATGRVIVVALVVAGAAAAVAAVVRRRPVVPLATRIAVAAGVALVVVAATYAQQRRLNEHRYAGAEPPIAWIERHMPAGQRVALAGIWDNAGLPPVLPAFGPRLGNEVRYAGRFVDEMLREHDDGRAFARQLRARRATLLLVGRGLPPHRPVAAQRWADAAGWCPVARSARLLLYRAPQGGCR